MDDWERVRAWWPVKTDRGWRWLVLVERRRVRVYDYLWRHDAILTDYRAIEG